MASQVVGDGWLDEMLLNFFTELAKKVGDLFLTLTEPLKAQLKEMGTEIYRSGIERLQPDPPITLDKIISIAGDATADAIAEQVLIMSGAVCVQLIPFLNISAINQLLSLYADLSPDVEISRIITRRMVDALVREPLDQFMMTKYRPRRMSRSDAEAAYKAGKLSKEGFAEILAQDGIPDKDIAVILAVTDLEISARVKWPPAGPTDFETLLGDVALLDSWDGLYSKWIYDLRARIRDYEILITEAETVGTREALKRAETLRAKLEPFKKEEREVWDQREKFLTLLSSLRRSFAGSAYAQALSLLARHKILSTVYAGELAKEAKAVIPKPPIAKLKMRGTALTALHDQLRRLETAAAAVKPPGIPPPRALDVFITGMPPLQVSVPTAYDKMELDRLKYQQELLARQEAERKKMEAEEAARKAREEELRRRAMVTAEERSRIR